MNADEIRQALERHWAGHPDQDAVHAIYAPNVRVDFPQSGESILGRDNLKAMRSAYPNEVTFQIRRIRGSGNLWITELDLTYDGATSIHVANIMEFVDDVVVRETIYVGDPFEAPAWRTQWVEMSR
jgi:hypothetical protein